MILNISQILAYQKCPVAWFNQYMLERAAAPTAALADGTYWHQLAAAFLSGTAALPVATNPTQDRMRHFIEEGGLQRIPTVAIEQPLRAPLGRHTLVGTPDGITPTGDKFYSLQWKTCGGGQDLERKCDEVKYSYYEVAYEALMNANGYPCAGTLLGVYRKLTEAQRAVSSEALTMHILERDPEYTARVLAEIESYADEMDGLTTPRPRRSACIQGNFRCPYWGSCYEGVPLSDARYVPLERRY